VGNRPPVVQPFRAGAPVVQPFRAGLYLGLDCSTQSLTAVVIDTTTRTVVFRDSLPFEQPFLPSTDRAVVHADPAIWRAALETMFGRLAGSVDVRELRGMSGSAQQHGSVYCAEDPNVLTRPTAPIWMDSSTPRECNEIESALGGAQALAQLTGSRAFPRFTGPQIRKFAREDPAAYAATTRIHLVSSWLASLLIGAHAPIDHADGSGMNLMDLCTRDWSAAALEATAPDLARRLPPLVPSSTIAGTLHRSWCERFGMPPVPVVAWSGDNPSSLVGTGVVAEGQLAISLGTSDTIFGPMTAPRVSPDGTGHVFASPTGEYMGITVFRNGSLARERVRDQFGLDWAGFSDALRSTEAGNGGAMMLPWFEPEITPPVPHGGARSIGLDDAPPARHVRAVVEGQMMALAIHSSWMEVAPSTISATGGAAASREILQVMADVFDASVHQSASPDSAALGAALRASHATSNGMSWADVVARFAVPGQVVTPVAADVDRSRRLRAAYLDFIMASRL
jgi:xylulokinase